MADEESCAAQNSNNIKDIAILVGALAVLVYFVVKSIKAAKEWQKRFVFVHPIDSPKRVPKKNPKEALDLEFTDLYIKGRTENDKPITIHGWLISPSAEQQQQNNNNNHKDDKVRCVIFVHGWLMNAESLLGFAKTFLKKNYHCFFMEATNHGLSDNDPTSPLSNTMTIGRDIKICVDHLSKQTSPEFWKLLASSTNNKQIDNIEFGLMGFSLGASACFYAAGHDQEKRIKFIVSLAAFACYEKVIDRDLKNDIGEDNAVIRYYARALIRRWCFNNASSFDKINPVNMALSKIACNVMLVHGSDDETIPLADHYDLLTEHTPEHLQHQSVIVDGADHLDLLRDPHKLLFKPQLEKFLDANK